MTEQSHVPEYFGEIMDAVFGRQVDRPTNAVPGSDVHQHVGIRHGQALEGGAVAVTFDTFVVCQTCHGSGSALGVPFRTCFLCGGGGRAILRNEDSTTERSCPLCGGAGQDIGDPCLPCRGDGRTQERQSIEVMVPAGAQDGTTVCLVGRGEAGIRGGTPGDLLISFRLKRRWFFGGRGGAS